MSRVFQTAVRETFVAERQHVRKEDVAAMIDSGFPSWVQCPNVTGISIQLSKLLIMPHEAGNTYQLKLHNLNLVFPKFPFIQYHVNYCGVPWGHSCCTLGTAS